MNSYHNSYHNLNFREESPDNWVLEADLEGHEDWVRDVAWAPAENLQVSTIASCGVVSIFNYDQ